MNNNLFLALLSRMDRITRWNKSRPTQQENLNDHSLHVALIALLIGLKRKELGSTPVIDPYKLSVYGMLHDISEVLSEDVNGVFKIKNEEIRKMFKEIEASACEIMLKTLPDEFQKELDQLVCQHRAEATIKELVKAADLLHALTKTINELSVGNLDFRHANKKIEAQLVPYLEKYPEVQYVFDTFINAFSFTIDTIMDELPDID